MDELMVKLETEKAFRPIKGLTIGVETDSTAEVCNVTLYLDDFLGVDASDLEMIQKQELAKVIKRTLKPLKLSKITIKTTIEAIMPVKADLPKSLYISAIKDKAQTVKRCLNELKVDARDVLIVEEENKMGCCRGNQGLPPAPTTEAALKGFFQIVKYDKDTKDLETKIQGKRYIYKNVDPQIVDKVQKILKFSEGRALAYLKQYAPQYEKAARTTLDKTNPERFTQIAERVNNATATLAGRTRRR